MEKMEGRINNPWSGVLPVYFCFSPATDKSLFYQMAISATSDTMVGCQAELIIKAD
jgi:hypothetical protein